VKSAEYSCLDRLRLPAYDSATELKSGALAVDAERCSGCGICVWVCPGGCLVSDGANKIELMRGAVRGGRYGQPRLARMPSGATQCIACGDCGAACPREALRVTVHFDPGHRFKRLTQTDELTYPRRY